MTRITDLDQVRQRVADMLNDKVPNNPRPRLRVGRHDRRIPDQATAADQLWALRTQLVALSADLQPLRAFTIPVAFLVTGQNEDKAAKTLAQILGQEQLTANFPEIECWWFPNHPDADGGDSDTTRLHWDSHDTCTNNIDWDRLRNAYTAVLARSWRLPMTKPDFWARVRERYETTSMPTP